jgi:hypothetical protein
LQLSFLASVLPCTTNAGLSSRGKYLCTDEARMSGYFVSSVIRMRADSGWESPENSPELTQTGVARIEAWEVACAQDS